MDFVAAILFMAYELQKQLKKYWINNRGNQLIRRNSYRKYFKRFASQDVFTLRPSAQVSLYAPGPVARRTLYARS